ncbi:MAG: DNA polymerase III subunit gamma/tau [Holosporales bacterium]|nr:DNA polymerase III subunit gamma/tau [Holosporales bacterium]
MNSSTKARRVLARKYRPKDLKDVIGQGVIVQALSKGVAESHLPQAILFNGIRGTGKTTAARILARLVNCENVSFEGTGCEKSPVACGACRSCCALAEDRHPDILEMDAASHTGVDDIREIIDSVQYRAIYGRYKVFIIDEVHMLSKSAFNALLKTLEEPPSHVLFIFATTEVAKVPETILSRCARFDLKRIESRLLIDHFQSIAKKEGYDIEQDALALLARAADGSARDGLTLLDQAMNLTDAAGVSVISGSIVESMTGAADRRRLYCLLEFIIKRQHDDAVSQVRQIVSDGADPVAIMQDLLECVYRVACFKVTPKLAVDATIPEFERSIATSISSVVESMQILSLWKKLLKGFEDVKKAPYAVQAIEMVVLRLCFAAAIPSLDEWISNCSSLPTAVHTAEQKNNALIDQVKSDDIDGYSTDPIPIHATAPILAEHSYSGQTSGSSQERPSIHSVDDLMRALDQYREALLSESLMKDFAFINFSPGHITVHLKNPAAENVVSLLKQFLFKLTGDRWAIELSSQDDTPSLHDVHTAECRTKEQAILQRPFIQSIQEEFPGASVEFAHKPLFDSSDK